MKILKTVRDCFASDPSYTVFTGVKTGFNKKYFSRGLASTLRRYKKLFIAIENQGSQLEQIHLEYGDTTAILMPKASKIVVNICSTEQVFNGNALWCRAIPKQNDDIAYSVALECLVDVMKLADEAATAVDRLFRRTANINCFVVR